MARAGHRALMCGRLRRAHQWLLYGLWGLLLAMLVACVPQVVVTQPQLMLHVHNDDGEVIPAEVTFYWWEYPHRRQRAVTVVSTNEAGIAAFAETVATETMMPLVLHGAPAYNWTFCVEAAGYKTLIGTVSNANPGEKIEAELILHRGESLSQNRSQRQSSGFARMPHPLLPAMHSRWTVAIRRSKHDVSTSAYCARLPTQDQGQ